jgi:hypothetical protein
MSTATATAERRRLPRRQPTLGTVCRLESGPDDVPRLGLVWNISPGGVSLLLDEPMEPGTSVRAELATLNEQTSLPVGMRVAHLTRLQTGDFCVGCQFDRELVADEIRPFLG